MLLISLVGSAGSGKNAVADVLIERYGFQSLSFAGCLKDAVSVIFGWDRALLEGDTAESRLWREEVDEWWANELGMPGLTRRMVLQQVGTEAMRKGFHRNIWLAAIKRKITNLGENAKIVITDARFPNELDMTAGLGGYVVRIKRGDNPVWWDRALDLLNQSGGRLESLSQGEIDSIPVHQSEWCWARADEDYDFVVHNDGTLDDLRDRAIEMFRSVTMRSADAPLSTSTAVSTAYPRRRGAQERPRGLTGTSRRRPLRNDR